MPNVASLRLSTATWDEGNGYLSDQRHFPARRVVWHRIWGIMNNFIGIAQTQTTNGGGCSRYCGSAAGDGDYRLVAAIPAVVIYNIFAWVGGFKATLGDVAAQVLLLQKPRSRSECERRVAAGCAAQKLQVGVMRVAMRLNEHG